MWLICFFFFKIKVRGLSIGELLKATRAQQALREMKESSDVVAEASLRAAGIPGSAPVDGTDAGTAATSTEAPMEFSNSNSVDSGIGGEEEAGKGTGGRRSSCGGRAEDAGAAASAIDDNDNGIHENSSGNANEGEEEKQNQSMRKSITMPGASSTQVPQPAFPVLPLASPRTRKMLSRLPPPSEDELDKLNRLEKMLQEATRSLPTDSSASSLPALKRTQQPRRLHEINLRLGEGQTLNE